MSILGPSWLMLAGASALSAALAGAGAFTLQGRLKDGQAAELRSAQLAESVELARKNSRETDRRIEAQAKVDDEQTKRDARERAVADATAAAVHGRLLGDIARLERRTACDTTLAGKLTAAEALGAVFRDCQAKYQELERDATDDRSRGLSAEGKYDALRVKKN